MLVNFLVDITDMRRYCQCVGKIFNSTVLIAFCKSLKDTAKRHKPRTRWIDIIAKNLRVIYQNTTYDLTYTREKRTEVMKTAMVLKWSVREMLSRVNGG